MATVYKASKHITGVKKSTAPHGVALLTQLIGNDPLIGTKVADIITQVKTRADQAIMEYTERFDQLTVERVEHLRLTEEQMASAREQCPPEVYQALKLAAERIKRYHEKQLPQDFTYTDETDVTLGNLWRPVERAGVYVPGGVASYPSSVLMNVIPATVAGVTSICMMVPAPRGRLNPAVLVAADIAGVTEIYTIGGAQAIAALAYGTETIDPVDVIVGPGNAYVAEAKKQVYGQVGIDMIAGPSEILVVADETSPPAWIAMDLLSQAEHDADARSILICTDESIARAVEQEINTLLQTLERKEIAQESWHENGAIVIESNEQAICELINRIAPEHLELMVKEPQRLLPDIRNAGALFLGSHTPEAIGDYTAGPSHVLPTSGTARFSSGLSVYAFLKRMSLIDCSKKGFDALAESTQRLAETEGLGAHAGSITIRTTT